MRMLIRLCALFVAANCGCATIPDYQYGSLPDPRGKAYRLQAGDLVQVRVLRNSGASGAFRVGPDGSIHLPLGGQIQLEGLTLQQARHQVAQILARYIDDAERVTTVSLSEVRGVRYTVIGEVRRPGVFNSQRFVTVLEALATAGGLSPYAEKNKIYVLRQKQRIPVAYSATLDEPRRRNFFLLSGDIIVVP